jgi:hypothetical protein
MAWPVPGQRRLTRLGRPTGPVRRPVPTVPVPAPGADGAGTGNQAAGSRTPRALVPCPASSGLTM